MSDKVPNVTVVLGMHKSGTTLVSEILHKSGINMVEHFDESQGYYMGNKMERVATLEMNHQLLHSKGISSLDIPVEPHNIQPSDKQIEEIQNIISWCEDNYDCWGFKDPRTCITYPIWKKYLPPHKLILVYRHPAPLLSHYNKRSNFRNRVSRYYRAMNKWKAYNQQLLNYIQQTPYPYILFNYEDLMNNPGVFEGLEKFVGKSLTDARNKKISKNSQNRNNVWKFFDRITSENAMEIFNRLNELSFKA